MWRYRAVLVLLLSLFLSGCPYGPFSSQSNPYDSSVAVVPNDARYLGDQWYLDLVHAPRAWSILDQRPLDAAVLAVIDKQPYALHEDLVGVYTDDGMNFVDGVAVALAFPDPGTITSSSDDHGNHVTGLAAAIAENGTGIAGLAYNRQNHITVRVMPIAMLNSDGNGTVADLVAAMLYAAGLDNGRAVLPSEPADVISMSLGASSLNSLESALMASVVEAITSRGVILVAAAGNGGGDGIDYPAAFADVVAVGSVDAEARRSSFSDYGPEIDIVAPGSSIMSSIGFNEYGLLSGTSMATPLVSSAIALVRALVPSLSSSTIYEIMTANAVDLGAAGFDQYYGYGLLDVHAMLASALVVSPYDDLSYNQAEPVIEPLGERIREIVASQANPATMEAIELAGSELIVLFDPDVTAKWEDIAGEFSRLAESAGINWRSIPDGAAPLVGEAVLRDGKTLTAARSVLLADPAILIVSDNKAIIR